MLRVALTGGIASGKTAVSNAFSELGVPIIDADIVARDVVKPGQPALDKLVREFGQGILTQEGVLDRPALRKIIFSNADAKAKVESILHPAIRAASKEHETFHKASGASYLIHVIPLLVETGQARRFDRVLLVDVPEDLQKARLEVRDHTLAADAQSMIDSQASRAARRAVADDILNNTGTIEALLAQVQDLHVTYTQLASQITTPDTQA